MICVENGLSIVENPQKKGMHYGKWLGNDAKPSHRQQIRASIDAAMLKKPVDVFALLDVLKSFGYEIMLDKIAFGQRIITARTDRNLTQDQLSECCGVSSASIRQMEAGNRGASVGTLISLCNVLQISPAYLLQDSLVLEYPDMYDMMRSSLLKASPRQAEFTAAVIELMQKLLL